MKTNSDDDDSEDVEALECECGETYTGFESSYWRYMRVVQLNYVLVCCESVARRVEVSRLLPLITDGGVTRAERLWLPT